MRVTLRLIISLAVGIVAVTLIFARYEVQAEKRGLQRELSDRAEVLAESIAQAVEPQLDRHSRRDLEELRRLVDRFGNRRVLAGLAVYGLQGELLAASSSLGPSLTSCPAPAIEAMANDRGEGAFLAIDGRSMHVYAVPLHQGDRVAGVLAVFDDAGYIEKQSSAIVLNTVLRVLVQMVLVALIILLIVRWSIQGPIARMAQWMRAQRAGQPAPPPDAPDGLLKPIAREVAQLTTSLAEARLAAEQEAVLREAAESQWTAERLRARVRSRLPEGTLFVVSNREPYMHIRHDDGVHVLVPASGLVTAMEPVLLACGGTWIAHGSGNADPENTGPEGRLRVPPDSPQYTLRRVWLTPDEVAGYYYGFANEGLWPLCHIAFARPIFRAADWEYYRQVNQKFADAVLEEIAGTESPLVLIQDYHFALLPRMVKQARPDARVSVFWHIPWPNPQVFGICPWERELLDGLLGADCVGFHIQGHCNHFLETVDDALEARVDREHFAVQRLGHRTAVLPFPISVAFAEDAEQGPRPNPYLKRAELFKRLGVEAVFMGVGVDRVDYTKGLIERLRGVERFLERFPRYCGQFTFVQIGAPSRTEIERYATLLIEVDSEVERINTRFQTARWRPIVFLKRHHSHLEIAEYYRAADLCVVTSLHDGMNLVAKEFVASRSDDQGVLILSRFTGAARQLPDALIVNPYDTEEIAAALLLALEMNPEERSARMRRMRESVREHNIYRWAASLIGALLEIRLEEPSAVGSGSGMPRAQPAPPAEPEPAERAPAAP